MNRAQMYIFVGVFTVGSVTGRLLSKAGYENAPLMVLTSGLIAGGALAYLGFRADRK